MSLRSENRKQFFLKLSFLFLSIFILEACSNQNKAQSSRTTIKPTSKNKIENQENDLSQPLTINNLRRYSVSNLIFGAPLVITASDKFAGAIDSLTWKGKEFINSDDHGRELQSASSFDNLGECFNPTEAGSGLDNTTATSKLLAIQATGNQLRTHSQMAYWLQAGQLYPQGCGLHPQLTVAQNPTNLSNHRLSKQVTIGALGFENVIEYLVTFHVGEAHGSAVFEALTGYMTSEFSEFWTYKPKERALARLSEGPGEQASPIIFSTQDQQFAMGIYSPDLPQLEYPSIGYGRWSFPQFNTMKWNAVFRNGPVSAGDYSFRLYVIVGNLNQSTQTMTALNDHFFPSTQPPPPPPPVVNPPNNESNQTQTVLRFYHSANQEHFYSLSYNEGTGAGFTYEGESFTTYSTQQGLYNPMAIYRCLGQKHFISIDPYCEGTKNEGSYGFVETQVINGTFPIYRFYKRLNGDHLYTRDYNEGIASGYEFEGILGYSP